MVENVLAKEALDKEKLKLATDERYIVHVRERKRKTDSEALQATRKARLVSDTALARTLLLWGWGTCAPELVCWFAVENVRSKGP